MEDIKQQGFENLGILIHALEVERLELGQGEIVLDVIEQGGVLPSLNPLAQLFRQTAPQNVRESEQATLGGVDFPEIADLIVKVALILTGHGITARFDQHLDE